MFSSQLAFHAAGTYNRHDGTGGLEGACMRFRPEKTDAHNKGLYWIAKHLEDTVKVKHKWITHSDLWVLAALVSVETSGGPVIKIEKKNT